MFSAVSWGPPLLRAKNVRDQHYKGTFAQKERLCFVLIFAGYPVFLYILYLNQNITVLVQGLREGEFRGMTRTPIFLYILY